MGTISIIKPRVPSRYSKVPTSGTYADFMAGHQCQAVSDASSPTPTSSAPSSSSSFSSAAVFESVVDKMDTLTLPCNPESSTTSTQIEIPSCKLVPTVKLPPKPRATSGTYADFMVSKPIITPSTPSQPIQESIHYPLIAQRSKKSRSLGSIHAPKQPSSPPKKTPEEQKPEECVLFAPTEIKVQGKFGYWSNLKGDPEKLARLNNPNAKPLESRWAC